MAASPLDQFIVKPLIPFEVAGVDVSFTNSSMWMVVGLAVITFLFVAGMRRATLVPGRFQGFIEVLYEFVAGTVKDNVGDEGKKYFPFIFSIFIFVLFANLLGMVPYSFTTTSHIAVTFALGAFVFLTVTLIGFFRHGFHYLSLFLPAGTPWWLIWLVVPIELVSYLSRPVSLSIRLAANMTAGHILVKVLAGFVATMGYFGVLPLVFVFLLVGFEIFVAMLQAYIFAVLSCVYLSDAVHLH